MLPWFHFLSNYCPHFSVLFGGNHLERTAVYPQLSFHSLLIFHPFYRTKPDFVKGTNNYTFWIQGSIFNLHLNLVLQSSPLKISFGFQDTPVLASYLLGALSESALKLWIYRIQAISRMSLWSFFKWAGSGFKWPMIWKALFTPSL